MRRAWRVEFVQLFNANWYWVLNSPGGREQATSCRYYPTRSAARRAWRKVRAALAPGKVVANA